MTESAMPRVHEVEGELMLHDIPASVALHKSIAKYGCCSTFDQNAEHILRLKACFDQRRLRPTEAVIAIINVKDVHGSHIAELLMGEFKQQEILGTDEIPYARGLMMRDSMQEAVEVFDQEAGTKLRGMTELAVVVIDHGVAEVFYI
jgi:hypothetical protein